MKTNFFLVMALSLLLFSVCETLAAADNKTENATPKKPDNNTTTTVKSGQLLMSSFVSVRSFKMC